MLHKVKKLPPQKSKKIALLAGGVITAGIIVALLGTSASTFYIGVTLSAVGSGVAIQNYWADSKG